MSVFWHDVRHIIKSSRIEFLRMSILIGFLLTILNIFAGIGLGAKEFSHTLNSKLGMYFYIVDDPANKDAVYSQVIELQEKLEGAGLQTQFKDRDTALRNILSKRNSGLIEKFEEYGLGNPLPSALNVIFESEDELKTLKKIMYQYKNIISNINTIDNPTTLKDQEKRNLTAINLGYLVMGSSGVVIVILLVGIITFLLYLLKSKFTNFHKTIEIKKVLGAYYSQIIGPFLATTSFLLMIGYALMIGLSTISVIVLHHYLSLLLDINLYGIILDNLSFLSLAFIVEFFVLIILGWILAYFYTRRLIGKVAH